MSNCSVDYRSSMRLVRPSVPPARRRSSWPGRTGSPAAVVSAPDLMQGVIFAQRYFITDVLAKTNMSGVYAVYDQKLDRKMVLKVSSRAHFTRLYQRETDILMRGLSPMFPALQEAGYLGELNYIVMEHIDGVELRALLKRPEKISLARALEITQQVLYGLDALHRQEIVHRDIKPENIMVEKLTGRVRLLDFGLTCFAGLHENGIIGTPSYLSPEQALCQKMTAASDIYSLGLVLYEMLAGVNPLEDKIIKQTIDNQKNMALPPLPASTVSARIASDNREGLAATMQAAQEQFQALIDKMTDKSPARRFQSVAEVLAQLEKLRPLIAELAPYGSLV